jgi:hypothetical protein
MSQKDLLLNFNYTNTTDHYRNPAPIIIQPESVIINHIHGKIKSTKNSMIFGFGDELDDDYRNIERDKAKGFFNYINPSGISKAAIIMTLYGLLKEMSSRFTFSDIPAGFLTGRC